MLALATAKNRSGSSPWTKDSMAIAESAEERTDDETERLATLREALGGKLN